ncbi:MAG: hypothetical protein ACRDOO_18130 [Actinomadura sp.]
MRPSDPFHRVYSPPEAPSTARRSTVVGVVMVVVAFSLVGFAAFVLAWGGSLPARLGVDSGSASGSGEDSPSVLPTPAFTALPPACDTVRRPTVNRLVPKARVVRGANTTLTTCTFTAAGSGSPWLRIETRIFVPVGGGSPVEAAAGHFAAQWNRARTDPVVRTVGLRRHPGLGDEAYRLYTIDAGRRVAAGQVVVRFRNAVIAVSYGENMPGTGASRTGDAANEREFVGAATEVAREVIGAFK